MSGEESLVWVWVFDLDLFERVVVVVVVVMSMEGMRKIKTGHCFVTFS